MIEKIILPVEVTVISFLLLRQLSSLQYSAGSLTKQHIIIYYPHQPLFSICLPIIHSTSCSSVFIFRVFSQSSNGKPSVKSYQHNHISLGRSSGLLNWLNKLISLLANERCPILTHLLSKIPSSIGW